MSAVRYESFEMPPRERLSAKDIETLDQWIQQGAWWPPEESGEGPVARRDASFDWPSRKAEHWAWQRLQPSEPPDCGTSDWPGNCIDAFIWKRLQAEGLEPSPTADAFRLVRRLYFDLIGLPPSRAQIDAFVRDTSDDAYRRLVDELLDSPHFGEKWARHWMDLVRYRGNLRTRI